MKRHWLWDIIYAMRKPHHPPPDRSEADFERILALLHQTRVEMSALTDAVAANTAAVAANTDATAAAVAKIGSGTPSDAQEVADAVTALIANTTQTQANTDALNNAQPAA